MLKLDFLLNVVARVLNTFLPTFIFSLAFSKFFLFIFRAINRESYRIIIRFSVAIGSLAFGLFLGLFVFTTSISIASDIPFKVLQGTLNFNDYPGSLFVKWGSIGALLGAGYTFFGQWPASLDQAYTPEKFKLTSKHMDGSDFKSLQTKSSNSVWLFGKMKLLVMLMIVVWLAIYLSSWEVLISSKLRPVESGSFAAFYSERVSREVPKTLECTYFIATGFLHKSYSYIMAGSGKPACPRIFSFADN